MTLAAWRVMRRDAAGQWMAPLDYTDKATAEADAQAAALRVGATVVTQQWDAFTGQWTPAIDTDPAR